MIRAQQGNIADLSSSLTNLVRSLGRREQDVIQSLISDTRDPFYNLPPELLICIFDFLHPYDTWSKRLVCRRWNEVLSSDNFTQTALNRFETHDPSDSALDPEDHASSSHMLQIRHILALRNGRPFSYVNYRDRFAFYPDSHFVARQLRLKGKHIAYLRGNADTCEGNIAVVRNLVTGETKPLTGIAREKIAQIELSTDIIALLTHVGIVYVASLVALPDSLRSVRLPSSTMYAVYADRGMLTCLLKGASGLTVFIHDTETRKSTSFNHDRHAYCDENEDDHCHAVLLNSHDRCIDIFSVVTPRNGLRVHVKVMRYSLTGERKRHEHLTIEYGVENVPHVSLGPIMPAGERGLYQLALSSDDIMLRGTLLFDANFIPSTVTLKLVDRKIRDAMVWKDRLFRHDLQNGLIDTARRPHPFDGPHTLRALSNEVLDEKERRHEEFLRRTLFGDTSFCRTHLRNGLPSAHVSGNKASRLEVSEGGLMI